MSVRRDLREAYRRACDPPTSVRADEAAAAGLRVGDRVTELAGRYHGHRLWRQLLWVLRRDVLSYAVPAILLVTVTPVVPWALERLIDALTPSPGGATPGAAGAAVILAVAATVTAALRLIGTWRVRRLIALIELCVQRLLFRRLAVVDERWLRDAKLSTSSFLLTYPQQLSQVAFLPQLVANAVLVVVLGGCMVRWYGPVALVALAVTGALTALLRYLLLTTTRIQQRYARLDHERTGLLEIVTRSWQPIRRQYLEGQVLTALRRVRAGQLDVLRRRAVFAAASRTLEDSLPLLVSLAGVGAMLLADGPLDAAHAFSLLVLLRIVLAAVSDGLTSYRVLRVAAETTRELDAVFRDAPVLAPATGPDLAAGAVELHRSGGVGQRLHGPADTGGRPHQEAADDWRLHRAAGAGWRLRPGERVAVIGPAGTGKSRLLERLLAAPTGDAVSPAVDRAGADQERWSARYGGSAALVTRGQPAFDGTVADLVTLWTDGRDAARYQDALARSGLLADLDVRTGGDAAHLSTTEVRLSEGQTVRLSLAQTLYLAPDVLLLDDVFAPLDPDRADAVAAAVLGDAVLADRPGTCVFVTSRLEYARYADRILLVGHDDAELVAPADLTDPAHQPRCRALLGDELHRSLRQALDRRPTTPTLAATATASATAAAPATGTGGPAPLAVDAHETAPLAADAYEATPEARPSLGDIVRSGSAVFPNRALLGIVLGVAAFTCADLVFAVAVNGWRPDGWLPDGWGSGGRRDPLLVLAALVALAVLAAGVRHWLSFGSSMGPIDRLHNAIFRTLLSPAADARRSAISGRLVRDFFSLEMMTPPVYVSILAGIGQSAAVLVLLVAGAPAVLAIVLPLLLAIALLVRRSRGAVIASAHLSAALRGPVLNFGAAALSCAAYRLSEPIRNRLSARFDRLADLRAAGMHRVMWCRLRVLGTVEAIALGVLLAALAGALVVPAGSVLGPGLLLFVGYTFAREFAGMVERVQTADTLTAELGRLSDILDRPVLPRPAELAATTPDDPQALYTSMLWVDHAEPAADRDLLTATDLSVAAPGGDVLVRDFSLAARPGTRTTLTGPSGVGKSLLVQTLAGARQPVRGEVLLTGRRPDVLSTATRRTIMVVESDLPLLPLEVGPTITPWGGTDPAGTDPTGADPSGADPAGIDPAGADRASAVLTRVCRAAGVAAPALDERLDRLSHSRRQLVNLTRALVAAPRVLVLDEATSALDPAGERGVLSALPELAGDAAILSVLHRPDNQDCAGEVLAIRPAGAHERDLTCGHERDLTMRTSVT